MVEEGEEEEKGSKRGLTIFSLFEPEVFGDKGDKDEEAFGLKVVSLCS